MKKLLLATIIALSLAGCGEEKTEKYPPMVTEMAVMESDASCVIRSFTTDAGRSFTLATPYTGVTPRALWRFLVGFVEETDGRATVYSLEGVVVPRDSTHNASVVRDPVGFVSGWTGGGFANLHLAPKTKGGTHTWGYVRDSVYANSLGGTTYCLSLFHRQGTDPLAYSAETYVSLPFDSIASAPDSTDLLELTVATFDGPRTVTFILHR